MGYIDVGGLTPFRGSQTTKVTLSGDLTTHCGGQTMSGFSALSIFNGNKILSVFSVL
jgi:hypothetical protein